MRAALFTSMYIAAISAGGATAEAQGGTTDIEPVLTLATLNVGGDGPQAEYLGGKWQGEYGPVEVAVGAKLLFLANYDATAKPPSCTLGKLKARYDGRYGTEFETLCEGGKPTPKGSDLLSKGVVEYIFGEGQAPKSWDKVIQQDKCALPLLARYLMYGDLGCFQADFMTNSIEEFYNIENKQVEEANKEIEDEGKKKPLPKKKKAFPGLSSLDQSGVCKNRAVFPFFGKGFMELAKTAPDMTAMQAAYVESVEEPNKKNETCPNKRASNAHIPLMAFDFFVLKEFRNLNLKYDEVIDLTPKGVKERKNELVKTIRLKSDVFFVQESEDVLTKDGNTTTGQHMLAGPFKAQATLVGKAIDTSIFLNGDPEKDAWRQPLYEDWIAFVKKVQGEAAGPLRYMVSNFEPDTKKDEHVHDVSATTIALAEIKGLKVMLMSAHPKSNGRPCALFAYMARRFFKKLRKKSKQGEKPDLLLVGMDANVLTTEDQEANAGEPTKNGWTWGSFKEKCEYMGYHVVHDPKRDTVHKQRTFLQTQLGKAAKKDKTKKDILLAYSESCEITIDKVTVLNTDEEESTPKDSPFGLNFGYDDETAYPTSKWPLDHFLTIAKLKVTRGKEQKWTGQLQDWEDEKYKERKCMTLKEYKKAGTTGSTGEVKSKKPKLAGDIEAMMDMAKDMLKDKAKDMAKAKGLAPVGLDFDWCKFRGQFDFADNDEYAVIPGNMKLMQPDIKREDWGAYDSSIFESGRVTTYNGDQNAEDWKKWEMREIDEPPPFPVEGLPSDHLPVLLTLTYKGGGEIKVGTFNVLSVTKSSLSAASFPGFPEAAHTTHNDVDREPLDITASSTWIVKQLEDIRSNSAFGFDIMALQEIDYPLYNALVNMDKKREKTLGFDILQQCGDAKPVEGKRASQMELLRTGWPRGKDNVGPRKDIPAIVWDKTKLRLVGCTAVGTISSIGFCRFEWKTGTAKAEFNLLAMHGDGDKGFRAEEAAIVKQQLEGAVIHAVVGDLNLHAREDVLASVTTLSGAMEVPDHKGASVYRYVHPFRKVVQNMQNSKSYACTTDKELKCPKDLKDNRDKDFTIDEDKKAITKYKEKNLDKKQSENFYKLCESHIWAGTNNKGVEDFTVLTWNAGGGQPTPEFLGGDWEYDHEGLFGEIEKLTGVMLFDIAKCDVKGFGEGTAFEKYKARYGDVYNRWAKMAEEKEKTKEKKITAIQNNILKLKNFTTPRALLAGLPDALGLPEPDWVGKCESMDYAIRSKPANKTSPGGLGLCDEKEEPKPGCRFDLSNEACFPLRHGLPVYGEHFMELLRLDSNSKQYWEKYLPSLLKKQKEWPEKGCKPVLKKEDGTPDAKMRIALGITVPEGADPEKAFQTREGKGHDTVKERDDKIDHASFTYEMWTQVAAWDRLVVRIARFAAAVKGKKVGAMPHIKVMPADDVTERIQTLVNKAATVTEAKVIFLQERKNVNTIKKTAVRRNLAMRGATADTAIFVDNTFAKIDDAGTKAAEAAWAAMLAAVKGREKDIFSVAYQLLGPLRKEQLAKMDPGGAAPKWVDTKKKLETIVVTTNGLLLLSIHADGDGYFCAQYLHMAAKMFDKLKPVLGLNSMIIGMDTNVQPPPGHLAFAKDKGYDVEQLKLVLPPLMRLIEPQHRTVLKVRTFLQTQFGKIGKNDDIKKDMLFQYGGVVEGRGDRQAKVMNDCVQGDTYFIYNDDDTTYYPKNDWPVDHFMVSQKVYVKMGEQPKVEKAQGEKAQKEFAAEVVEELVRAKRARQYLALIEKVAQAAASKKNNDKQDGKEGARVLARSIGPQSTRAREVFHKLRAKLRTLSPLRRPKVAKPAAASVTKHHSIAKKIKKYMSKFSKKVKRMIFGREA